MAFAQRLATRDIPPPPPPLLFDRASVEARIADGLRARLRLRERMMYPHLAAILYSFLEEPRWYNYALANMHQREESVMRRALRPLMAEGLLERVRPAARPGNDRRRVFLQLTRAGEDWLQAQVQAPLPDSPAATTQA